MLKNKSKLIVVFMIMILLVATISFATNDNPVTTSETNSIIPGDNARVDETTTGQETTPEIYNGDLYLFDNDVVMDKFVDGNVFIIGKNVEITGRVNGILCVLAENVTISKNAYIIHSLYVAANQLNLNGVANDLYATCNKVDMSFDSFIIRDLKVLASTFNFNGGVGRDAFVRTNQFNFVTDAEQTALIYGNLDYSSSNELSLSQEFVQGNITYSKTEAKEKSMASIVLEKVISLCETLLYTAVVFVLAMWLAPKFIEKSSSFVGTKSILAFGIGALTAAIAILVSFTLLFSYIGIPLAFAIFGLFVLMASIAFAITSICITYKIVEKFKFEKKSFTYMILAAVAAILWILTQVPYVGWLVSLIVTLIGLGVVILYIVMRNKLNIEVKE